MEKTDFEEIFTKGFNREKIDYEDAKNGESDLRCFTCGKQAGLKEFGTFWSKEYKVVCTRGHQFELLEYTIKFTEMVNDLLECGSNQTCDLLSDA